MVIAVTGATGNLGGSVAVLLRERGHAPRLIVRDTSRAPAGFDVAQASYADRVAAATALAGVDLLFMVSGSEAPNRLAQHRAFIDAAAEAGVRQVVYTSFLGASPTATFTLARDHWATEEHLRASGMAWTILRDSFYQDFLPDLVGEDGVIRGPAGAGRVGAVARSDITRCAAAVLAAPDEHRGARYDLTGPEALSLDQVASILSEATGRTIRYRPETLEEAYASRAAYGAPDWQVEAWVSSYSAIAAGELDVVSDAVERLTGRPPLSLARLLAG